MLSWFNRNNSKPSKSPPSHSDGPEQQHPQSTAPVQKIQEKKPTSQDPHLTSTVTPPAVPSASPAATAPISEQQQQPKSTFTAAFNTPHDAVLAELQGHDPPLRTDVTPSTSALGMQSIDTLPAAASDAPGSVTTSSSPPPELLYDPFTGVTTGVLSPAACSSSSTSAKKTTEELWVHLARIRSLQADVARLHLTMEGIGLGESTVPHLRSTGGGPRAAATAASIVVGERLEDDENADGDGGVEAEKRREREFERSERRFDGRKEEIGQIMTKLDELSQALAAFHMLDTPMFNSTAAAAAAATSTVSSTPVPRHPDLHRVSLGPSPRGREEIYDSPASVREPLPIFEEPESMGEHAQRDALTP